MYNFIGILLDVMTEVVKAYLQCVVSIHAIYDSIFEYEIRSLRIAARFYGFAEVLCAQRAYIRIKGMRYVLC